MVQQGSLRNVWLMVAFLILFVLVSFNVPSVRAAVDVSEGEKNYQAISAAVQGKGDSKLLLRMKEETAKLDWTKAQPLEFVGHLRLLRPPKGDQASGGVNVFLVRKQSGEIFILAAPQSGVDPRYANLEKMLQDKMAFKIESLKANVDGRDLSFARFIERPHQLSLDKIFKICIVLMLFFVLMGMGLTLTVRDFVAVFTKPLSIVVGLFLQYGLLPLAAVFIGRMMGFYDAMPFVFIGIVLVMASPGGVMSNLFTQLTRGDLALSISLTAISTILSLVFTPLLLNFYCSNVPDVEIPVSLIVATIVVLVVLPLTIGMTVRAKWPDFAQKSKKVFTALGLAALLFLVCAGVLSNLETFKEIQRYGMAALASLLLACSALILGIAGSKLSGSGNSQNRAMTYQCLIRNTSLSMAIALLMQDIMGDFYSSMFVTAALYSICMFIVAGISIAVYKKLPVE